MQTGIQQSSLQAFHNNLAQMPYALPRRRIVTFSTTLFEHRYCDASEVTGQNMHDLTQNMAPEIQYFMRSM